MEALYFTGKGSEYFKIWIVNILLIIITFGIYYPWAKVRNRRYFYANSNLGDRNFEYHATGKQLVLGFLIGVFFLVIYSFATQIAPQFAWIIILLFMLILPWIIWRSLMFNMKVTSFSNVHFAFKGNLKTSYMIFLGYPLLASLPIVVLGILVMVMIPSKEGIIEAMGETPLMIGGILLGLLFIAGYIYFMALISKKSKEYKIGNSFYGQGIFSTSLEVKKFLSIYVKAFGLVLVSLGVIGVVMLGLGGGFVTVFVVIYIAFLVVILFVKAYVTSRERAYVYKNTFLDNKISLESTLSARALAWVMFTNLLMIIFTLGLATPWAKVRIARLMLKNTLVDTSVRFNEYITQQKNSVNAIGDQVGDAFDVDADVGF